MVCISFVYFFTPEVDRMGGPSQSFGSLYGKELKRQDMVNASTQARISMFLKFGQWPNGSRMERQLEQDARQRLFLNKTAEMEGITVSDEQVGKYIKTFFSDRESGKFSKAMFENVMQTLGQFGVPEEAFYDYVRSQVGIQHLQELNSVSGTLISTRAAETLFRRENEQIEAEVIFVERSNYLAQVEVTTNAVSQYFTNNSASFRIPERVVVNYVFFDFSNTNFVNEAQKVVNARTNLATEIDTTYADKGTNAFLNAEGKVMSAEEAKQQIRADMVDEEAGKIGLAAAVKFANAVFTVPGDVKAENLANVAKQYGYEVKESQPFTEFEGPEDLDVPANFASQAFRLSPDEPLGGPLTGVEGTYLISYNRRVASEIPALTNVWDDVVDDFKRSRARELTVQAGSKVAVSLAAGLASGKNFEDLAKTNKVESISVPTFARSTRSIPQVEQLGLTTREFITAAFDLETGYASGFRSSGSGGYIVYVKKRTPASDTQVAAELPAFLEELRRDRQNMAFKDWFQTEFIKSGLALTEQSQQQ